MTYDCTRRNLISINASRARDPRTKTKTFFLPTDTCSEIGPWTRSDSGSKKKNYEVPEGANPKTISDEGKIFG